MFTKAGVATVSLLLTLFASLPARAQTCESLFDGKGQAEALRKRRFLAHEYRTHLRSVQLSRDTLRDQFFEIPFSEGPKLAAATVHFIESSSTRGALTPQARVEIANDPYFRWLTLNKKPETSDPVDLFFSTLVDPGPSHLNAKLSLIRVIRDLDPTVPTLSKMRSILLIFLNKIAIIVEHRVLPVLEKHPEQPIGAEILNLEFLISHPGDYQYKTLHDELFHANEDLGFTY